MEKKWALILGASSGFGGASAVELAKNGYNIFGVHLDRQATILSVQQVIKKMEKTGQKAVSIKTPLVAICTVHFCLKIQN